VFIYELGVFFGEFEVEGAEELAEDGFVAGFRHEDDTLFDSFFEGLLELGFSVFGGIEILYMNLLDTMQPRVGKEIDDLGPQKFVLLEKQFDEGFALFGNEHTGGFGLVGELDSFGEADFVFKDVAADF